MYPQRHRRGARPTGQLQASSCRQLQTGRRIAENEQFENSTVLATPPFSTELHYHATLFSTNCSFFFQTSENILCPKETDLMKVDWIILNLHLSTSTSVSSNPWFQISVPKKTLRLGSPCLYWDMGFVLRYGVWILEDNPGLNPWSHKSKRRVDTDINP